MIFRVILDIDNMLIFKGFYRNLIYFKNELNNEYSTNLIQEEFCVYVDGHQVF